MYTKQEVNTIRFALYFKWMPILFAFLMVGFSPVAASAFDILLGTGEAGTFSHFTGRLLTRVINKHADDINCITTAGPGEVHNITNLSEGSLDIALIDSRMLHDAANKSGNFEFLDIQYDNLRTLIPLYDVPVALIVKKNANITSLEELKGKRINAGAPRSLQHLALDTIMKAKNWSKKDFGLITEISTSLSQDTMAFCQGTVQGMVHIGVHPDSSLQQLFRLCGAGMANMNDIDIEKLVNDHPAFSKIKIAADTYPDQPIAVTTFGTSTILVASQDLDEETAYKIIDAIFSNQNRLKNAHPALSSITLDMARKNGSGIKLHRGAVQYFLGH